jgi:hypothetical protein
MVHLGLLTLQQLIASQVADPAIFALLRVLLDLEEPLELLVYQLVMHHLLLMLELVM